MKRILSLLLAGVLTASLLVSPGLAAAAQPWVQVGGTGTASRSISLHGAAGSWNGVQLTLKLDKVPSRFQFDQSLSGSGVHATYNLDGSSLTLYAVSKDALNRGDIIALGTLSADQGLTVEAVTDVKLVELDPDAPKELFYGSVSISEAAGNPDTPSNPSTGVLPFTDVKAGSWYYDAVSYVYDNSLMNGTGTGIFSPMMTTNRGMIVTILHRYEGSPAAGANSFPDVKPGMYYSEAVAWAAANGIVNGYSDGRFAPDDTITREQMAAILYRYAGYKGLDVSGRADLSAFADGGRVSPYARDAMAWANQAGLINGVGSNSLSPGGSATRAEAAAILMRFCQNVAGDP